MRSLICATFFTLAPVIATAQSNVAVDAELFKPQAGNDFFGVGGAQLLENLKFEVGAFLNFAQNPLVVFNQQGQGSAIVLSPVKAQSAFDLVAAIGLKDRLELGFALPVVLLQNGENLDPINGSGAINGGKLGDIRLDGKVRLVGDPKDRAPFALNGVAEVTAPTGDGEEFFGSQGASFFAGLSSAVNAGKITLGADIGARFRPQPVTLVNVTVGNELKYGVGLSYAIKEDSLLALAEVDGYTDLIKDANGNLGHAPTEARLGAKIAVGNSIWIPIGIGIGVNQGIGAPDFRALAGLTFAPKDQDPDHDSILGRSDKCPADAEDKDSFQDEDGCPELDNDNDKIADKDDKCPTEAEDKDSFQDEDGCPDDDNDSDGVADAKDKCPNDVEDKDGFQDEDGCPELDNDFDKIADKDDKCPIQAEDQDGFEDQDGCPELDNDNDGIADTKDKCPLEVEDKDGFQDEDGCPELDNDNDKIADKDDKCPLDPEDGKGAAPSDGCPETTKAVVLTGKIEILDKIFFDSDKATLQKRSLKVLDAVVAVLKDHPEIKKLRIEGNTDDIADDKFNQKLSEKRAEAVLKYLVKKGIDASRLDSVGYGESKPLVPTEDKKGKELDAARDQNRRVEFVIEQ